MHYFKSNIFKTALTFLGFVVVFGLIFLPYPLNNSFVGNIDIWFYVWQWNDLYNQFTNSVVAGQVLYPEENYSALVGSPLGYGILYIPIKSIFRDDIWTMYAMLVSILSINAFVFSAILQALKIPLKIAVVLAFCLFANNFVLSNLENFNAYTFYPGLIAIFCLIKSESLNRSPKYILVFFAGVFAGLQVYYSIYLFLLQAILWIGLLLSKKINQKDIVTLFVFLMSLILVTVPFFSQRQEMSDYLSDPSLMQMLLNSNESHSIYFFKDWFRVNVGNVVYPPMNDIDNPWRYGARSAFLGVSTYILVAFSLFYFVSKRKWQLLICIGAIVLLGMLVSTGPMLRTNYYALKTPIGWINNWLPSTLVIRHLFRAHLITIIGLLLLIGFCLKAINAENTKRVNGVLVLFVLLFIIENIPFNSKKYNSKVYTKPPEELMTKLSKIQKESKLFFMPSCHILESEQQITDGFNPMNREYIYMVWKNYLPYHIYNGRMGYLTNTSYDNTLLTCDLTHENYKELMDKNEIDYFVLVRDFVDQPFLENTLPTVLKETNLVGESGRIQIHQPK